MFWRTDAHISSILLGSIAYLTILELRQKNINLPKLTSLVGVLVAITIQSLNKNLPYTLNLSLGTLSLAVAVANLEHSNFLLQRVLNFMPIRRLGMLSFSVYLWQQPFYRWSVEEPSSLVKAGLMLVAVGVGAISFYLVEQPARRWLNSLQLDWPTRLERRKVTK